MGMYMILEAVTDYDDFYGYRDVGSWVKLYHISNYIIDKAEITNPYNSSHDEQNFISREKLEEILEELIQILHNTKLEDYPTIFKSPYFETKDPQDLKNEIEWAKATLKEFCFDLEKILEGYKEIKNFNYFIT